MLAISLVFLMLLSGISKAWGQTDTDRSGIFYFVNCGSGKNNPDDPKIATITDPDEYFYLVPADSPKQTNKRDAYYSDGDTEGDPNKPYLTTYRTKKDAAEVPEGVTNRPHNSVWIVKFASTDAGTDYYYIIHAATGKYVVYEPPFLTKNNRKSVHLLTTDSPGENAKFAITLNSSYYNFRPKSISEGNRYFNTSNRNFSYYYSHSKTKEGGVVDYYEGLVGLYSATTDASSWKPEATLLSAPTINFHSETNTFSISYDKIPTGYTILYTIDGNIPTIGGATTSTYSSPVPITESLTVKAVVVRYGMILTEVAERAVAPAPCATPVITFDYTTSNVSISCSTPSSTIYYTTDGSTPTTSSTQYSAPFSVDGPTTVKAIATHTIYHSSAVAELAIAQVATPTIQNNGSNAISITTTTPGATIYYTTDGTTPTTSSTEYTEPLTDNVSNVTIKAIAVKENMITSTVGSGTVKLQCATPVITRDGMSFTLSCSKPTDAKLYYTIGDGTETLYSGAVDFTEVPLPTTVTAVARHSNYTESDEASMELKNGSGTPEDPYMIYGSTDFNKFVDEVNSGATASASYKLGSNASASGIDAITTEFTGTFDGDGYTISSLGHALFNRVNGGTVKNVILDNVSIGANDNGNAGAICNEATGDTRIYNCGVLASGSTVGKDNDGYDKITLCSSSINGSNYAGSIVGLLDGSARVINCFSYANVSGGTVGGIVGYNNVATTASNLKTMVMNCMYYGEVSGSSIAPIYNGEIITNDGDANGVNNFNYFRLESSYIEDTNISKVYNCALGAETRFLQRFEFFRYMLNSNRELAAWWATGDAANKDEMMKWVLEPSQIGSATPYPVLKTPDYYPSVVNIDAENASLASERNKGKSMGTLSVTIQSGNGARFNAPTGASITKSSLTLNITDKDFDHFNFNYYKVQLPYYNEVGEGNYTGNRVVTGWKIVSITGGTSGSYSTGDDVTYTDGELTATPYNFADRKCTNKDLYSESGRIFNQGAYWDVPEGVTAITIEPYWANAVYLSDAYWDVVYKNGIGSGTAAGTAYDAMSTAANVPNVGGGVGVRYTNGVSTFNGQTIYTSMSNAISSSALFSGGDANDHTVYDYAVVLVGNYHQISTPEASNSKPYTVTSVDMDGDNEPDYSFMLRFNGRTGFHPVRYDFLNLIGLGMAQKSTGSTGSYNLGIIQPKSWFEVTNTALFRVTQFEYSPTGRAKKPIILQGGVIEQWVTQQNDAGDAVSYFHVGGNIWFKEFHRGSHQDNANKSTPHPPVSVTGGDFNKFYLTGLYQSQAKIYDDNAECYINGGRFGEMAGAGMEGIGTNDGKGNITWVIDNADIKEFYGGGINAAKPVHGNIHTIIRNSYVDQFCGGPKFGDMVAGRTVTTTATDCTFGTYFGAGFGGNSYNRQAPRNHNNIVNFPHNDKDAGNDASWNAWLGRFYTQAHSDTYGGVSTQYDYQFLPMSSNTENVARIFVEYVKFSLATCRNVTSTLTGCKITGNFYGGGSLGKVDGPVTSTLENCMVNGSVFGAGFSGNLPTVEVDNIGFRVEPYYYEDLGTYRTGVKGATTTYTWAKKKSGDPWINNTTLYTTENLDDLGTVSGNVTLNILGDQTQIMGDVYGGAAEAKSNTNYYKTTPTDTDLATKTTVNLIGGTIRGDVYGGGLGRLAKDAVGTPGSEGYQAAVEEVEANVGNTVVNLNGMSATEYDSNTALYSTWGLEQNGENKVIPNDTKGCVVSKRIFGCNNLNGTPKGSVTVHVYKTQNASASRITNVEDEDNPENSVTTAKQKGVYDVKAVYGGGNLAAYEPTDLANAKAHVIIDGCGLTSIETVYGGGNAASAPATLVEVNGTYEIEELFGGGNGKDAIDENTPNPGAHVGYQAYPDNATYEQRNNTDPDAGPVYIYGTGRAQVNINGGTVHAVYGGSNTKGNVREIALAMLEEISDADGLPVCDFHVDEAYGGGKSAPMDGEARLEMKCIPGMTAAYGGSRNADVNSGVTLNITNGKFEKVFGGNNEGGCVKGSITVNIEETGCRPVEIGELYGGGNQAAYSKYGYKEVSVTDPETSETTTKWVVIESPTDSQALTGDDVYDDPQVNVKSFTSIGSVFGGGLGATATMVADPHVNINQVYGKQYDSNTPKKFVDPATTLGTIGTVYGGGNAAPVIGDTYVNVGTKTTVDYVTIDTTKGETEAVTGINVVGANITGNVYGGGNAAKVTGRTKVTIGKESTTTTSPAPENTTPNVIPEP